MCIDSCVFRSSLLSFLSSSRFKSQFGRFGAMLNKSWIARSACAGRAWVCNGTLRDMNTHQVLRSPLGVLCDDLFRQAVHSVLHCILHLDVFTRSVFLQRPRLRVE